MKVTIQAESLSAVLGAAGRALPARPVTALFGSLLLQAQDGKLAVTGTDGDVRITVVCPADVQEAGALCTPASTLTELARCLPAGADTVLFEGKADNDYGKLRIAWGENGNATLSASAAKDYPAETPVDADTIETVDTAALAHAIAYAAPSASDDKALRPVLSALLLHFTEDGLDAVATDAHTCAIATIDGAHTPGTALVPARSADILRKLIEKKDEDAPSISLRYDLHRLEARTEGLSFSCALLTGKFPDYAKIIPSGGEKALVDRREAENSLRIMNGLRTSRYVSVSVSPEGVEMECADQMTGISARQKVHEEGLFAGNEPLRLCFNTQLLAGLISRCGTDQVQLTVQGERSPVLVEPARQEDGLTLRAVIMPSAVK